MKHAHTHACKHIITCTIYLKKYIVTDHKFNTHEFSNRSNANLDENSHHNAHVSK